MVRIEGGEFAQGSDRHYPEERPVRRVGVDAFRIDAHPVTNEQFAQFVAATGYVTLAERPPDPALYPGAPKENLVPGSMVFVSTQSPVNLHDSSNWWRWTPGANWSHPLGPASAIEGLESHPVVQIAYEDAEAYCSWAGVMLPTEAQWEYAARGGLEGAEFIWGDDDPQETKPLANTWQGTFPYRNTLLDGHERTSPVGSYPPNGYGLFDMAGDVWEWTSDWYVAGHGGDPASPCCVPHNPRASREEESLDPGQPQFRIPRKVVKGGSHLCARNYCFRYRPAARQPQMIDTGQSHVGFRTVDRG
ncbi:MAG: formylglycine-generating enzyme family protein [Thermoleophilia bacterium]|nr:formylglycine-generating enzyme family protein [Thermoleophilia bacterium]